MQQRQAEAWTTPATFSQFQMNGLFLSAGKSQIQRVSLSGLNFRTVLLSQHQVQLWPKRNRCSDFAVFDSIACTFESMENFSGCGLMYPDCESAFPTNNYFLKTIAGGESVSRVI
jgi:hypothetical protein